MVVKTLIITVGDIIYDLENEFSVLKRLLWGERYNFINSYLCI